MKKTCQYCNKIFEKKKTESKKYWVAKIFCSSKCYGLNKKGRIPSGVKLWKKGEHVSPNTEFKRGIFYQFDKKPTSIEKLLYDFLVMSGIVFEKQYLVNRKFLVDAFIPSLNLVIEADGNYWHSLPKNIKKDKAENAYLTACGFDLIRLEEQSIHNNSFVQILKERGVGQNL